MIADNIAQVRDNIAQACARVGRNPQDVTLIAVSKTHPAEAVLEAVDFGLQHFGENRVEEGETKIPAVTAAASLPLTWHMIGHVQSRKAKEILPLFQYVHSLDSLKLASKFSALALEADRKLDVLLEINISGEESKYGLLASGWVDNRAVRETLWGEISSILSLPGLQVRGLMTMAPIVEDPQQARPVFAALAQLRQVLSETFQIELPDLSMGMTDDYPVAIEEGATMVRVGRAIFGDRQK